MNKHFALSCLKGVVPGGYPGSTVRRLNSLATWGVSCLNSLATWGGVLSKLTGDLRGVFTVLSKLTGDLRGVLSKLTGDLGGCLV